MRTLNVSIEREGKLVPAGMIWIAEMQPRALLPFVPPLMESGPESPLMRSVFAP